MEHIIKDYLKDNKITLVEFCKAVDVTTTCIQLIYSRKRYPSRELCQRIYQYTAGAIHPMDLLEIEENQWGKETKSTSLENNLILENDLALEDNSGESVS